MIMTLLDFAVRRYRNIRELLLRFNMFVEKPINRNRRQITVFSGICQIMMVKYWIRGLSKSEKTVFL